MLTIVCARTSPYSATHNFRCITPGVSEVDLRRFARELRPVVAYCKENFPYSLEMFVTHIVPDCHTEGVLKALPLMRE